MRFKTLVLACCFGASICSPLLAQETVVGGVEVKARRVAREDNSLDLVVGVHNLSDGDVWLCTSNDYRVSMGFDVTILDGTVLLSLASHRNPQGMAPEYPILGRFEKLSSYDRREYAIRLKSPMRSTTNQQERTIDLGEVRKLEVEIGWLTGLPDFARIAVPYVERGGSVSPEHVQAWCVKEATEFSFLLNSFCVEPLEEFRSRLSLIKGIDFN